MLARFELRFTRTLARTSICPRILQTCWGGETVCSHRCRTHPSKIQSSAWVTRHGRSRLPQECRFTCHSSGYCVSDRMPLRMIPLCRFICSEASHGLMSIVNWHAEATAPICVEFVPGYVRAGPPSTLCRCNDYRPPRVGPKSRHQHRSERRTIS